MAKRERQAWQRVDALIGTKRPADYTAAVELLVDLRDVSGRKGATPRSPGASAGARGARKKAKAARTLEDGRPVICCGLSATYYREQLPGIRTLQI